MEIQKQLDILAEKVKSQISEIEKSIKADLTGKAEEQKKELEKHINDYQELVKKEGGERQAHIDKLDLEIQKLRKEGATAAQAMTMSAQAILLKDFEKQREAFQAAKNAPRMSLSKLPEFNLKTAGNMTFAASATGVVVDRQYVPGIFGDVRRRNRVRQILTQGVTSADAVPYVVQTGGEGGAAITAEGGEKPQTDKDIELKTAPVRKIAHHIRVGEELLNDLPALSSFLTNQGIEDLYDTEDTQLLYGTGAGSPAQIEGLTVGTGTLTAADVDLSTSGAQKVDAIYGAMQALAKSEYQADSILMNPADIFDIMVLKDTNDGQYLNRIGFDTNGRLVIKGLPVFESTAVNAGDFIVAELRRAAQMYQRSAPAVRFFDQDQDNAVRNLITIVIEERLALAKPYQDAIFFDTFADVIAAIT